MRNIPLCAYQNYFYQNFDFCLDCGHVTEMTIAVTTAMKTLSIAQLTHASPANTGVAMVAVSSALGSVTMKTTAAMAPTS